MTLSVRGFTDALWPTRSLAVAELNEHGTVVAANDVLTDLIDGATIGRPFADLAAEAQRPAVEALLESAGAAWTGMTAGLAPDEQGVPFDYALWVRDDGDRTLVVAEPQTQGMAMLNSELLRLNDDLIAARRDAAKAADSERAARSRAEASTHQLRNVQRIVDITLADLSLDDLLRELLTRLCQVLGADAIEALLVDELDGCLVVRSQRGLPDRGRAEVTFPINAGLPGQTLAARRPLQVRPVTAETGVSAALADAVSSLVCVPLLANGNRLGILLLGTAEDRDFTPIEIEMLELAAVRIGGAIERVLSFERERDVASILQESLMPGPVPALPGLAVATRYKPAGVGHRVGGDFYDVFGLAGNRAAAVVGDVRGKGPEAAARTALVRFTARALATREESPAALLGDLNRAMIEQSDARVRHCSIVIALFDLSGDGPIAVNLASGGHPLSLARRADGTVEELGAPGSLVGLMEHVQHRDRQATLAPGDLVVFYTDGVTEARRGVELFGEERLSDVLRNGSDDPERLADQILAAVEDFNDGPLRDDTAIVVVKAERPGD